MKKRLKIGIDARMFSQSFTGIGRYTFELTQRFFERKDLPFDWVLFLNDPEYTQFKNTFPDHVKVVQVNAPHYSFAEQTRFLFLLNKENCDLVHFTHFNVPLFYSKPFIVTIHDTTISFYPGKKMNQFFHKLAYKKVIQHAVQKAKKIITVSYNTQKDVERLFSIESSRIQTIHNGISSGFSPCTEKEKESIQSQYNLSSHFLLYAGVWREHKNLVRLLYAFNILLEKINTSPTQSHLKDLQLVLTGKPDLHYPEILETIQSLQLTERVQTPGLVPANDLALLFSSADIFVFPSLYEGFGIPPLEAMQSHTPVCASRTSSIPEICGDAVEYFDPLDVSDIAQSLFTVLTNPPRQKELIQNGLKRIHHFSWDQASEDTLKIYQKLLQ